MLEERNSKQFDALPKMIRVMTQAAMHKHSRLELCLKMPGGVGTFPGLLWSLREEPWESALAATTENKT